MASVVNDVLLAVLAASQIEGLYAPVKIGAMPADNGIAMYVGSAGPDNVYMDKSAAYQITLTLNAKHRDAETASDALNNIHAALTMKKQVPACSSAQITAIETIMAPFYQGREERDQNLYSSSIRVKFYFLPARPL